MEESVQNKDASRVHPNNKLEDWKHYDAYANAGEKLEW